LLGFIGHELGHAIHRIGALQKLITSYEAELEADRVAGFVLAQAGLPHDSLQQVIVSLSQVATPTHAHGHDRTEAIHWGYLQGLASNRWWLC